MQVKPADGQSGKSYTGLVPRVRSCRAVWNPPTERRVFVGQLDSRHDRPFLESLFERFGPIEDIRFLRESDSVGQGITRVPGVIMIIVVVVTPAGCSAFGYLRFRVCH